MNVISHYVKVTKLIYINHSLHYVSFSSTILNLGGNELLLDVCVMFSFHQQFYFNVSHVIIVIITLYYYHQYDEKN